MKSEIKDYVKELPPHYTEKSTPEIDRDLGLHVVQMGSNINPAGPSPFALKAIFDNMGEIHHYPNSTGQPLREGIAKKYYLAVDKVLVGNGVTELAKSILSVYCEPGDEVLLSRPTSLGFQRVAVATGLKITSVPLAADYSYDFDALADAVTEKTSVVFLVNPNDPTGTAKKHDEIKDFLQRLPEHVLVMVDESAIEYATDDDVKSVLDLVHRNPNLVVLRSFSIIYGLAGLRCAYAVSNPELIRYASRATPAYAVNFLAQVGCLAALDDDDYVVRSREANKVNRDILEAGLKKLARYQLTWIPSQSNFITIFLPILGDQFSEALLRVGFRVRSLSQYGIDNAIRITIGSRPDTIRSVYAMARVLKELLGSDH